MKLYAERDAEAAMQNPKAYYWMGKWHREEAHMADDLPCNAPHDKQPLFAFPPDAQAEIEWLRGLLWDVLATKQISPLPLWLRAEIKDALAGKEAKP